jgi:hypothetical protein
MYRVELETAIAAYNAFACGTFCYRTPTMSAVPPTSMQREDRRVHLRPAMTTSTSESAVHVDTPTGRILNADMAIPSAKIGASVRGAFSRALALALGMRASVTVSVSVLSVEAAQRVDLPTASDRERICSVYEPAWCSD